MNICRVAEIGDKRIRELRNKDRIYEVETVNLATKGESSEKEVKIGKEGSY